MKCYPGKSNTSSIIIGLVVIVIVGLGIWTFANPSQSGTDPSDNTSQTIENPLEVTTKDWQKGGFNPKVTLIEYADFQCPACGSYYPLIKQLEKEYPDQLRIVFRHFPLVRIHKNALPAAHATEAAGRQGKFFEMHDAIYEHQSEWSDSNNALENFKTYAKQIGLNVEQFTKDYQDPNINDSLKHSLQTVIQLKINSTPTFFVNGKKIANPMSYEDFKQIIQRAIDANVSTPSPTPSPSTSTETQTQLNDSTTQSQTTEAAKKAYHAHADFKVYLKNKAVDFTEKKYQSMEGVEHDEFSHLHDGNGNDIHLHKEGLTLGHFFQSLKINFQKNCFNFSLEMSSCLAPDLKLYVNGKLNDQFDKYILQDLDKILITDNTDEKEIQKELASITDDACLYSETCPERGKPPTENCVGGLGTDCTV